MKISEMTTDQAADTLVRVAAPISAIMQDKDSKALLESLAKANAREPLRYIANNLSVVVSTLLKKHRRDVYEIAAALSGKAVQDIGKQNILVTIRDLQESMDEELLSFFGSSK